MVDLTALWIFPDISSPYDNKLRWAAVEEEDGQPYLVLVLWEDVCDLPSPGDLGLQIITTDSWNELVKKQLLWYFCRVERQPHKLILPS